MNTPTALRSYGKPSEKMYQAVKSVGSKINTFNPLKIILIDISKLLYLLMYCPACVIPLPKF
jgi:hypothetical protein